jgi:hypothetical protein
MSTGIVWRRTKDAFGEWPAAHGCGRSSVWRDQNTTRPFCALCPAWRSGPIFRKRCRRRVRAALGQLGVFFRMHMASEEVWNTRAAVTAVFAERRKCSCYRRRNVFRGKRLARRKRIARVGHAGPFPCGAPRMNVSG